VSSRFLDIAHEINVFLSYPGKGFLDEPFEHKVLPQILDSNQTYFSLTIDLASLAFRREFLNLEKWVCAFFFSPCSYFKFFFNKIKIK